MKRVMLASIPLLVALVSLTVIACFCFDPGFPQSAHTELDRYLATLDENQQVVLIVRADHPWQLSSEMSLAAVSQGGSYRTRGQATPPASAYRLAAVTSEWGVAAAPAAYDSRPNLPYPPEQVWCVRTRGTTADGLLLVAYYQDLYGSGWVIHPGTFGPIPVELYQILDTVGCNPGLFLEPPLP